jgi:hypothetical protein
VLEWQIERHLGIAAFYHRIGRLEGQMRHLEIAAGAEYASTAHHAEAVAARDELQQRRLSGAAQ